MIPLLAMLPFTPAFVNVCESGCDYLTIQAAVDDVPLGGSRVISIDEALADGTTRIDGGRQITLLPYLSPQELGSLLLAVQQQDLDELNDALESLETVTLTQTTPTGDATITVEGGALTVLGLSVDGGLSRAIDATDAEVTLGATTVFGRGVTSDGGLVRIVGGQLTTIGGGFRDGAAAGLGGLVAIYDADASITLSSFSNGSAARGACFHAESTDPKERHEILLTQTTFRACEGSLQGGAIHMEGALDVTVAESTVLDSTSGDGGAIALLGPDLVATIDTTAMDNCLAFNRGGGLFAENAAVTLDGTTAARSTAFYGGGVAAIGGSTLTAVASQFEQNGALYEGGGLFVDDASYYATDTTFTSNVAGTAGGGLWLGNDAVWAEDIRSTVCGNQAGTGGGIRAHLTAKQTVVHNLRLLDNIADLDGGGLFHTGAELELSFANLLGNSAGRGSGAAVLSTANLSLNNVLVGYNLGSVAIVPRTDEARVIIGPTVWFGNERGDLDGLSPTAPGALFQDPLLDRYVPGDNCLVAQDWPTWNSPMRDAGTQGEASQDPDMSRADIGAYGGPNADLTLWETDRDEDGVPQIYDCDEGNPDVNPNEIDEPYDGIDADCRSDDDFDADRDGFRRIEDGGTDCNDERADIYPGAIEDPTTFEDANCDGFLDADGDGFERQTNSADVEGEVDCDDSDPAVYPGAPELGPEADYNCDGFVDGPRIYSLSGCQTAPTNPGTAWAPFARRR